MRLPGSGGVLDQDWDYMTEGSAGEEPSKGESVPCRIYNEYMLRQGYSGEMR